MGPTWILLLNIIFLAPAWGSTDKDNTGMVKMLLKMVTELRDHLEELEQENIELIRGMEARDRVLEDKVKELEKENSMQSAKLAKLEEQLTKEAAFLMTCATRNSMPPERNTTITFDYLTADFNNADNVGGADGQLDISTGVFTCLTGGIYEVNKSSLLLSIIPKSYSPQVTFSGVSVIGTGQIDVESSTDQ